MKKNHSRNTRGVTLIMVAAVLSILAALGTGFYTMTLMQSKSAVHYSDSVRAEMMAKGGIAFAIASLQQQTSEKTEDPTDPWYAVDYLNGAAKGISLPADDPGSTSTPKSKTSYSGSLSSTAGPNGDRFILGISDAASKININAGDNLAVILDNLCRAIGPPLVAANQDALQPRRWALEGATAGLFDNPNNVNDTAQNRNLYYWLYDPSNAVVWDGMAKKGTGRPKTAADGTALYGDGYAIAGYRARNGPFHTLDDIKNALTYVERNNNGVPDDPLEQLEIEVKFAALRDYITVNSWVDSSTVCVGKFEWVNDPNTSGVFDVAVDRDKSWVVDRPDIDPLNTRGSLRGCYLSIVNGHGSGQLRRIKTNGIDWIQIETINSGTVGFGGVVAGAPYPLPPGPISSYMIVAPEDARLTDVDGKDLAYSYPSNPPPAGTLAFPKTNANGTLVDEPNIDYSLRPLCIHRAPVNINTASDKVLAALFMGINVQAGHPLAIGTDSNLNKFSPSPLQPLYAAPAATATNGPAVLLAPSKPDWKSLDNVLQLEPYLLTPKGLKRIPADSGKIVFNRPMPATTQSSAPPWPTFDSQFDPRKFGYLNGYGMLDPNGTSQINEAQELAYRIIKARQRAIDPLTGKPKTASDPDPITADADAGFAGYEKGAFQSWDDLYFRVVKPWDDIRSYGALPDLSLPGRTTIPNSGNPGKTAGQGKASIARMIMAHFNCNTDILKFNPNIEWIDRWGRNFTEMEPVMVFQGSGPDWTNQQWAQSKPPLAPKGSYFIRSMRYKSDEMIDKSDMNRSTTEFSFDSGGIYEIESVGQVVHQGEVQAERKVAALVKVYDVWRESTQAQFVQGTISLATGKNHNSINGTISSGFTDRGKVVRDSTNSNAMKALDTLPEPLVPLSYKIVPYNAAFSLADVVDADTLGHDAFRRSKSASGSAAASEVPDVIANKVLPAQYDGQIVLASNTSIFDPAGDQDSFLASFNGDLDTDTSLGNGREQAKSPTDSTVRVVDTIGLLGRLNDTEVDVDPQHYDVYIVSSSAAAMQALPQQSADIITGATENAYWNNLSIRMGDLRNEGAYLGSTGTSLKDGTLKYLYGSCIAPQNGNMFNTVPPASQLQNYDPGNLNGCTLSLWFKPSWHATDNREHEFFDGGTLGDTSTGKYNHLYKSGRFSFSKPNGVSGGDGSSQFERNNDLFFGTERFDDGDLLTYLHGGTNRVNPAYLPSVNKPNQTVQTPEYETQPFRWSFTGAVWQYNVAPPADPAPYMETHYGFFQPPGNVEKPPAPNLVSAFTKTMGHPFISTQLNPEGPEWKSDYYWLDLWAPTLTTGMSGSSLRGQPAAYTTAPINAQAPNPKHQLGCFTINNVNEARAPAISWVYRSTPLDGTYAVVDELKLSKKKWTSDRIAAEQTLSRYYLPGDPTQPAQCPTFTSQTMLQSLKGFDKISSPEQVILARVTWTCFTPRFMHEYKRPGAFNRNELMATYAGASWQVALPAMPMPFKGPFDYCQYNYDIGYDAGQGWKNPAINAFKPALGVDRQPPAPNTQSHSTKGMEIEILDDSKPGPIPGFEQNIATGLFAPTSTFHNPDAVNTFVDLSVPPDARILTTVKVQNLRYRVRFRYPVSAAVDPGATTVDPARHYLLDTPVFDDISVTYYSQPRILQYREVTE